jgi:RNA methyltransferase, TrmH family
MGALFRVPLAGFEEAPGPRLALVPRAGKPLLDFPLGERATFVLGAEREGLTPEVIRECDEVVSIPTRDGAESLNVAVAGAIALYEWRRLS